MVHRPLTGSHELILRPFSRRMIRIGLIRLTCRPRTSYLLLAKTWLSVALGSGYEIRPADGIMDLACRATRHILCSPRAETGRRGWMSWRRKGLTRETKRNTEAAADLAI